MLFKSREDAGKKLGGELKKRGIKSDLILAIPRGGVPVGYEVAKILNAQLDIIIPRKLPLPSDPEAGFGAVIEDTAVLNEGLLRYFNLSKKGVELIIGEVKNEIKRRAQIYRGKKPFPRLKGKKVVVVDDGLASGYTMLAALQYLEKKGAAVTIAIPVSSSSAFALLDSKKVIALHVSDSAMFAVANFYEEWRDLNDNEVIAYLNKAAKREKK